MAIRIDWGDRLGRRLKLRDLHVFFAVVERGSMAKAAAHLGVSQPTVSEIIADLEHTFGVRLLDRMARGVEPTIYGRALLKRSAAAFDELKQSMKDIALLADPAVGELRIGCAESIAAAVLPAILDRFHRENPRVVVHVDDVPSTALSVLHERKQDLVLVRSVGLLPEAEAFDIETLFNDRMVLATHASNPLSKRRKIKLAALIDEPWFLSAPETWAYARLAEALKASGLTIPQARFIAVSVHLRNHMLAGGRLITAIPKSVADWYGLKVLPVDLPAVPWPVVIVTLKHRTLSTTVARFMRCAREVAKSTYGELNPSPKRTRTPPPRAGAIT